MLKNLVDVGYDVENFLCNCNKLCESFWVPFNENGKIFQNRVKKSENRLT